jgi:hypothetical protein
MDELTTEQLKLLKVFKQITCDLDKAWKLRSQADADFETASDAFVKARNNCYDAGFDPKTESPYTPRGTTRK